MSVSTPRRTELWQRGALDLARAIRAREVTSQEVVEALVRRIQAVDPAINAVPVLLADSAREAARSADKAVEAGGPLPPLLGVPLLVKSNIDVAGTATTQGVRALAGAYPRLDAPIVSRMKRAGAIVLGRSNMPNFAVRWHCESELYGWTFNPWDRGRTAGGSSAAVAAGIATGMSPLGLGNDGLGSLRHPAQCCGVTTLKPTLGRIPDATSVPGPEIGAIGTQLAIVNGPIARQVADLRAALEILAGPTWRDPWSVPAPIRGPAPAVPIRVALVVDPAGQGTAKQVADGVRKAASALSDAGYSVEEIEPPSLEQAARTCLDMLSTPDARAIWQTAGSMLSEDTRRFLDQFIDACGEPDPIASLQSFVTRQSLLRAWGEFQESYPLILAPVCTEVPFPAGTDLSENRVADEIRSMRMVIAVNALGLPAVALPVGIEDGLPQAVQLIGQRYREDLCLDAAQALEDRLGVITPIDPR